jgi:hypothetical protein
MRSPGDASNGNSATPVAFRTVREWAQSPSSGVGLRADGDEGRESDDFGWRVSVWWRSSSQLNQARGVRVRRRVRRSPGSQLAARSAGPCHRLHARRGPWYRHGQHATNVISSGVPTYPQWASGFTGGRNVRFAGRRAPGCGPASGFRLRASGCGLLRAAGPAADFGLWTCRRRARRNIPSRSVAPGRRRQPGVRSPEPASGRTHRWCQMTRFRDQAR